MVVAQLLPRLVNFREGAKAGVSKVAVTRKTHRDIFWQAVASPPPKPDNGVSVPRELDAETVERNAATEPNHGTTAKPYKRQGFREDFHILEILVGSLTATLSYKRGRWTMEANI